MEQQQSFYSIDNSKTEFTFVEEGVGIRAEVGFGLPQARKEKGILEKFDIRQSSAVQLEESDMLNRSFSSVANRSKEGINVNDISAINEHEPNELECSLCLQNQIDCLSVPAQPSPQQIKALQQKISTIKNTQSVLQKQISLIHSALLKQNNPLEPPNTFIKKQCKHAEDAQPQNPINTQIGVKQIQEQFVGKEVRQQKKHFDIKPNRVQSATQKQANAKYKQCSFNGRVILVEDSENQYRVEVSYERDVIRITVVNFQRGETNFIHAARINQGVFSDKISQTISYPIDKYLPKRFTLSLSIMLLIFQQNKEKQQTNLLQIDQLRTLSLPLPINYFLQPRFNNPPLNPELLNPIKNKLYIYQIDINYNADYAAYTKVKQETWVRNKWISLKGSSRLIWVDLGEIRERDGSFGVDFRVGCKEKDCQQAVDLIEYLCFMLAI